jgi:succinyl-diaminopimelate desuccinylase
MKEQILRLTKELVAIPSVSNNQRECHRAIEKVKEFFGEKVHYQVFDNDGVQSILFGDPENFMTPSLLLAGHLDVVGGSEDMFTPNMKKKIMRARGAGDMKGHDAAMMVAYQQFIKENGSTGAIGLLLTTDEEVGGFKGARYLIERYHLRPKIVFVPDADVNFDIILSEKAPHHFQVRVIGRGGHAKDAYLLDNPHTRLDALTAELKKGYGKATPQNPWETTIERTVVESFTSLTEATSTRKPHLSKNAIPEVVDAWFSWRFPSEKYDFETERQNIKDLCSHYSAYVIAEEGMGEGFFVREEDQHVQDWKSIIQGVLGREVGYNVAHGASDGRHFAKYGSKVLLTSANVGEFHNDREWADMNSLAVLAQGLVEYQKLVQSKS